jgi:hypothetical protein
MLDCKFTSYRGCTTRTGYFKCREVKTGFTEINICKPVPLGLSLAGNPVKPLLSLYGTEWRERGYGLRPERIRVSKGYAVKNPTEIQTILTCLLALSLERI